MGKKLCIFKNKFIKYIKYLYRKGLNGFQR